MFNPEKIDASKIKDDYLEPHFKFTEEEKEKMRKEKEEREKLARGKEKIIESRGGNVIDFPKKEKKEMTPEKREEEVTERLKIEKREQE